MPILLKLAIVLGAISFLVACASVRPQNDRPYQTALTPASLLHWPALKGIAESDRFMPLNTGPEALAWRITALRSATRSVDLQTFIWKNDQIGSALAREIIKAADRGVQVRALLDDSFLDHADATLHALSSHPNIAFRIYNPVGNRSGGLALRQVENFKEFARINHRMHNKLMLIDGRVAIVGGRNLADEYFGYHENHNFRDLEILSSGPFIAELSTAFDSYWNDRWSIQIESLATHKSTMTLKSVRNWLEEREASAIHPSIHRWSTYARHAVQGLPALLMDKPASTNAGTGAALELAVELNRLVDSSQKDLLLISAYFIPTKDLTEAIERAVTRGVRVRVFTNSLGANNHIIAHAAYAKHRPAMLRAGAELYEMRADAADRAMYMVNSGHTVQLGLHAKSILIDDWGVFVGSANLDSRSLVLNTEVGIVVNSTTLNKQIRTLIEPDLLTRNAWRVTLNENGHLIWSGPDGERRTIPLASFFMRLESGFFGLLPIEGQI